MKLLFITRLYSGFEPSLQNLTWKPEGVPTIYNLFNKISNTYDTSIIFTAKDSGKTYTSNWVEKDDKNMKVKNLNATIKVLTGIYYFPNIFPRKLSMILRDIRQLIKIIFFIQKNQPKLIYCDSANVVIAYILTKIFPKKPIVVRVLGVCSFWRAILNSKRLVHKIYKLSYKGSFASVIGTQDGSGIEYWFDEVLKKNVPRYVLLNGVDTIKPKIKVKKIKNILFVGRLESYKGILVFIYAILKVLEKYSGQVKIKIIGDGTLYKKAFGICKKSGFIKNFDFMKSIPHEEVLSYHSNSDIYVSANADGNLINTNLEAISSSACMVIPKPQKEKLIDIQTHKYLKNSVLYYEINDTNDLAKKIIFLLENSDLILQYKKKIGKIKSSIIKTWEERVAEELKIIKKLIN